MSLYSHIGPYEPFRICGIWGKNANEDLCPRYLNCWKLQIKLQIWSASYRDKCKFTFELIIPNSVGLSASGPQPTPLSFPPPALSTPRVAACACVWFINEEARTETNDSRPQNGWQNQSMNSGFLIPNPAYLSYFQWKHLIRELLVKKP